MLWLSIVVTLYSDIVNNQTNMTQMIKDAQELEAIAYTFSSDRLLGAAAVMFANAHEEWHSCNMRVPFPEAGWRAKRRYHYLFGRYLCSVSQLQFSMSSQSRVLTSIQPCQSPMCIRHTFQLDSDPQIKAEHKAIPVSLMVPPYLGSSP